MFDPRNKKLAHILVEHSVTVQKGEKVAIYSTSTAGLPLAEEIYKLVLLKGAYPYLSITNEPLGYFFYKHATNEQLVKEPEVSKFLSQWADKNITIIADQNPKELANIDPVRQALRSKATKEIKDIILKKKWVVTDYPTPGMAYASSLSLHELEDFYFKSCLKDWVKEKNKMLKLKKILDEAGEIEIVGYKTDLHLSFTARKFAICSGEYNMPDGEIYAAPLEDKTEGEVYFDFPTLYQGKEVRDVSLKFSKGKVVGFDASHNKVFLAKLIEVDEGAKRLGEMGIGTNFSITKYMLNTLFDEKIGGTIHLALGAAYKDEEGGGINDSAIHWDMVKDMRKKGSKLIADGRIILKDGKFSL